MKAITAITLAEAAAELQQRPCMNPASIIFPEWIERDDGRLPRRGVQLTQRSHDLARDHDRPIIILNRR